MNTLFCTGNCNCTCATRTSSWSRNGRSQSGLMEWNGMEWIGRFVAQLLDFDSNLSTVLSVYELQTTGRCISGV